MDIFGLGEYGRAMAESHMVTTILGGLLFIVVLTVLAYGYWCFISPLVLKNRIDVYITRLYQAYEISKIKKAAKKEGFDIEKESERVVILNKNPAKTFRDEMRDQIKESLLKE